MAASKTPQVQVRRNAAGLTPREARAWETTQGKPPEFVSGNASIGPGARGDTPDPLWSAEIVRGHWPDARPRTLQLGTMPAGVTPNSRAFPVSTDQRLPGASYACAQLARLGGAGSLVDTRDGFPVACMLEYGVGSAGARVIFDWVPGSYNLPPCTFANVSVLPWGPVFASNWNETLFSAAVSPGILQGAHVPTVSGAYSLAEGDYLVIPIPDHARYFDVFAVGAPDGFAGKLVVSGGADGVRDFGSGNLVPGWTPLDVTTRGGNVVQVTCDDDGGLLTVPFIMRWWLAL